MSGRSLRFWLISAVVCVATTVGGPPTSRPTAQPAGTAAAEAEWPMFRGCAAQTGVARGTLPERPTLLWKRTLGEAIVSTAAIMNSFVYVGVGDGRLVALDLKSGRQRWQHETGDSIESSPTVAGGLVIFGNEAGKLYACDARDGTLRWTFTAGDRIVSSANRVDGRLVFGSYDGHVYCLRLTDGALIWKYDVGERVHGTPALIDGHVLAAACDAHLHVVKLTDGSLVRKIPLGSVTGASAAVRGSRAFVGTYNGQVVGLDWRAGRVLWRFKDRERSQPFLSSAALTDKLVIVGGRDKRLRVLELAAGGLRWTFTTKGHIDSSPVVVGERVFVGSTDGNLYAVSLETGRETWRYEAGGGIYASPAVAAGCLVIGTDDGVVYCFGGAARGG